VAFKNPGMKRIRRGDGYLMWHVVLSRWCT